MARRNPASTPKSISPLLFLAFPTCIRRLFRHSLFRLRFLRALCPCCNTLSHSFTATLFARYTISDGLCPQDRLIHRQSLLRIAEYTLSSTTLRCQPADLQQFTRSSPPFTFTFTTGNLDICVGNASYIVLQASLHKLRVHIENFKPPKRNRPTQACQRIYLHCSRTLPCL